MKNKVNSFFLGSLMASLVSVSVVGYADDTEIYFAKVNVENTANKPTANVLFLIDTSGSMCDPPGAGTSKRNCERSDVPMAGLRTAFSAMVDGLEDNVKVGLAKFNGGLQNSGYGGYVFYPVSELDKNSKADMVSIVNRLQGTSNTPTMEAYSEAARYMLGLSPTGYAKQGEAIQNEPRLAINIRQVCKKYDRRQNCKEYGYESDSRYETPIDPKNQCESNHIIVMTDGAPTADADYKSITNITGERSCDSGWSNLPYSEAAYKNSGGIAGEQKSFACQIALASYLHDEVRNNKKPIKTWQIAFGVCANSNEVKNMRKVAKAGGTEDVRYADNADELAKAFLDIMELIDGESKSISAPGVAVNTMNRFQHLDELYYGVFKPAKANHWEGNLKRYQLGDSILDANGSSATDPETGYFKSTAKSFWSDEADGAEADKGGARSKLGARKLVYSDASGVTKTLAWGNSGLKPSYFGLEDKNATQLTEVFERLKTMWGDPLHSAPLMINYGVDDKGQEKNYVFVSNNGGMLHIIDSKDGTESAAFMPHELFKKAAQFTIDRPSLRTDNTRPLYGLDGNWIAWRKASAAQDKTPAAVYLYGGMRRGGKHYYALDVTNPAEPKQKWKIGSENSGFKNLGQTWSTPTLFRMPTAGGSVPALVFGGGYSPEDHDPHDGKGNHLGAKPRAAKDAQGNAIYVVNAETGELIWSASNTDNSTASSTVNAGMKWSVPGGISVVDMDMDGVADYFYFADLGGQVFRVNLNQQGGDHQVMRIADLGGEGKDNRRFYEAPAVGFVSSGFNRHLYVAVASGYREHPLDKTTSEGLFVVFDKTLLGHGTENLAKVSNMANVTSKKVQSTNRGWYYLFPEEAGRAGEKAMSSPVIYDGKVLLSTYSPEVDKKADLENACAVSYGAAYLHTVDLRDGQPANKGIIAGEPASRSVQLKISTPPPSPSILLNEKGESLVVVGTEFVGKTTVDDGRLRKRRWMQLTKDEAGNILPRNQKDSE